MVIRFDVESSSGLLWNIHTQQRDVAKAHEMAKLITKEWKDEQN